MPCYTIRTTTVDIDKMNVGHLLDGLKAAGYAARQDGESIIFSASGSSRFHTYKEGTLTISGENAEAVVQDVKRAYAAQCVRATLGREWRLKETKNGNEISFSVTQRR